MAQTRTKTTVETTTIARAEATYRSGKYFIEQTGELGASWGKFTEEIEVICKMELIDQLEVVCHDKSGAEIAGVIMKFDWAKGRAIIENGGDEYDPSLLDEFGRPASVTESVDAMCSYLEAVRAETDGFHVQTWFRERLDRKRELGEERYYRLLGMAVPTKETRALWDEDYAKVRSAKTAGFTLESAHADIEEITHKAWGRKNG